MTGPRRQVELLEKNRPRQERAKRTYESILVAAAELLVEVGVERISTNLIAERAGITVPALYRYFPNKYAVINALGVEHANLSVSLHYAQFDHDDRYAAPDNDQCDEQRGNLAYQHHYQQTAREFGLTEDLQPVKGFENDTQSSD